MVTKAIEQGSYMDDIAGHAPRRTSRPRRFAVAAAAGLGIALGAAGIAAAAADPTASPSPGPGTQGAPPASPPGPGMRHGQGLGERGRGGLGPRGAVHGEFVVPDGTGWRTVSVQRGVVTAVSGTSLTVKSKDGYTRTYALTPTTMVNAGRDGIGSVKKGEQVAVVANVKSGAATAVDVRDLTQLKAHRKELGPPPGGRGRKQPGGTPASPSSFDAGGAAAQPA